MGKKILVIEDDPSGARLMQYTLTKYGYEVQTASNGLEGLRKARQERPDLILLDVMLPGIDGFEICHRLRDEFPDDNIPIVMLSGKARESDRTTGLGVGADDYLVKPVSPSNMVNVVSRFLEAPETGSAAVKEKNSGRG